MTDEELPQLVDTCAKCGAPKARVRWHVLPILLDSDCAAPSWAGEHLCVTCGRCGYVWAARVMEET